MGTGHEEKLMSIISNSLEKKEYYLYLFDYISERKKKKKLNFERKEEGFLLWNREWSQKGVSGLDS